MSLEKTIEVNNLIDLYGKLLTDKQLRIMHDYFKSDLSLSEIAYNLKISKQAVKYSIDSSLKALADYEEKLHLVNIKTQLNQLLNNTNGLYREKIENIIKIIGE